MNIAKAEFERVVTLDLKNFTFYAESLFCLCKQKQWFLWVMAATQAPETHGDKWSRTWYLWGGIYTLIQTGPFHNTQ